MVLFKRGSIWWFEFRHGGKRVRESSQTTNRRAAEKVEAARRVELALGDAGIRKRKPAPILKDFEDRFIGSLRVQKGDSTADYYAGLLKAILADDRMANLRLDAIDEAEIDAYVKLRSQTQTKHKRRKRPLSPATINRQLACLRRLLRLAWEWNVIQRVPRIRLLKGERQREFILSRQAEAVYLAACPAPLGDVAAFLLDTGLRVGELCSLDWEQVRLNPVNGSGHGSITVLAEKSKGGRTRHIPLTARAATILRRWNPEASGPVFHHPDGNRLIETSLAHMHKRVRDLLKMPPGFVLHSLRHTYGTRLGESGTADGFTIQRLMGHASITTSQRYVHPTPETLERAVLRMEQGGVEMQGIPTNLPTVEIPASGAVQ